MGLRIEDLDPSRVDDVFRVCSHSRLEDPLQMEGMEVKRRWLQRMLRDHGPCTKIAYLDGKPVAQTLYYPESADPAVADPRERVIKIRCTYNPFPEAQKKGIGSSLVESVLRECREGPTSLGGRPARFAVAQAFETGEGTSLVDFYASMGFQQGEGEMYIEVTDEYAPREPGAYSPLPEDRGRALILMDPECEWGHGFATRAAALIRETAPAIPVTTLNRWEHPQEARRRHGQQIIVNATPITADWRNREAFTAQIRRAIAE